MIVTLLAFGIAKEIFGKSAIELHLPEGATVGHLKATLEQQYPALARLKSFAIAVNSNYASAGDPVKANDEIAIIPPVSGG